MARKTIIESVASSTDKQRTYHSNMQRYNAAMKRGFYFEALLIDYAMLEDRTRAFLYHIGCLSNREDGKTCKKTKASLLSCLHETTVQDKKGLRLNMLSGKTEIIRATLNWAANTEGVPKDDKYLELLKSKYEEALDIGGVLETLDQIETWCKYRNEVIHGLLNKNVDSLQSGLAEKCAEGMKYARYLDGQIKSLKKGNVIRRGLKLPTK